MISVYALVGVLTKLHDDIDRACDLAQAEIAQHATHSRRSIAQRFRKLNRDLQRHDQSSL